MPTGLAYCPLDRVLTYKNLIYLLNLQVIADEKVGKQHIYRKYFKCNSFQVTTDLLNRENIKVAIAQLCNELLVCNFTKL